MTSSRNQNSDEPARKKRRLHGDEFQRNENVVDDEDPIYSFTGQFSNEQYYDDSFAETGILQTSLEVHQPLVQLNENNNNNNDDDNNFNCDDYLIEPASPPFSPFSPPIISPAALPPPATPGSYQFRELPPPMIVRQVFPPTIPATIPPPVMVPPPPVIPRSYQFSTLPPPVLVPRILPPPTVPTTLSTHTSDQTHLPATSDSGNDINYYERSLKNSEDGKPVKMRSVTIPNILNITNFDLTRFLKDEEHNFEQEHALAVRFYLKYGCHITVEQVLKSLNDRCKTRSTRENAHLLKQYFYFWKTNLGVNSSEELDVNGITNTYNCFDGVAIDLDKWTDEKKAKIAEKDITIEHIVAKFKECFPEGAFHHKIPEQTSTSSSTAVRRVLLPQALFTPVQNIPQLDAAPRENNNNTPEF